MIETQHFTNRSAGCLLTPVHTS